jgi:hypothetical protein
VLVCKSGYWEKILNIFIDPRKSKKGIYVVQIIHPAIAAGKDKNPTSLKKSGFLQPMSIALHCCGFNFMDSVLVGAATSRFVDFEGDKLNVIE